jgi:hypothetical protein
MDEVSLMKRVDTKFVVRMDILPSLLKKLTNSYRILEIGEHRLMSYDSTYFDTADKQLYKAHHNKRSARAKIRIRNYVESNLSFLEIKLKDNKGSTTKKRIKLSVYSAELDAEKTAFIQEVTNADLTLIPSLTNSFNRFTLVNLTSQERVTFDLNLAYNGELFNSNLAIIELKQEKLCRESSLFKELKNASIQPYSISKYCIGMASLHPGLKQNFFKHKLITIDKITS